MEPIDLRPKKSSEDFTSPAMPSGIGGECCPTVYLKGPKELADLPKEGTITFEYKREELSLRDREDRPVNVVLKLKQIVDAKEEIEDSEEEDDKAEEPDDSGEALDAKMRAALGEDEEIED